MIEVNGKSGVKVEGYRINIQAEFTELCHDLMFKLGFDQDELLFAISMASMPDEVLLADMEKSDAEMKKYIRECPKLAEVMDDILGEDYCKRKGLL